MDCLFRVKTITLETANVTNCHVIATDILFLSSNHRSVQFLYLAASPTPTVAILKDCVTSVAILCAVEMRNAIQGNDLNQDLSTPHDWSVKKAIVELPIRMKENSRRASGN